MASRGRTSSPAPAPTSSIDGTGVRIARLRHQGHAGRSRGRAAAARWLLAGVGDGAAGPERRLRVSRGARPAPDCRAPIPASSCRDRTGSTSMSRRRTAPTASGFCGRCTTRCWLAGLGWYDGQHQRRIAGALNRRPHGGRAGAAGVRGRASPGAAAAAGQGEPPPDRRRWRWRSTRWRRARR